MPVCAAILGTRGAVVVADLDVIMVPIAPRAMRLPDGKQAEDSGDHSEHYGGEVAKPRGCEV